MKILDLDTFRRLDILTRTEAGMPLHVFDYGLFKELPSGNSVFGRAEQRRIPVIVERSDSGHVVDEMFVIDIANYINLGKWRESSPPWLNKKAVPVDLIYDFIVWHEIAHVKYGDMVAWEYFKDKGLPDEWQGKLKWCTELRADRFAWGKLFPLVKMPHRKGITKELRESVGKLEKTLLKFKDDFAKLKRTITPIDTDPEKYIPCFHIKPGIPWYNCLRM